MNGLMEVRIQHVAFTKHLKDGEISDNLLFTIIQELSLVEMERRRNLSLF